MAKFRRGRSEGGGNFEVNLLILILAAFAVIYGVAALFNLLLGIILRAL